MRYDKKIIIHFTPKEEVFNPDLGRNESIESEPLIKYADISDLGLEKTHLLFGDVNIQIRIIRVLGLINEKINYIEYDGDKLLIKKVKRYRHDTVFYCYES